MKRLVIGIAACLVLAGAGAPAWAQSRPLVTEDPETVPAGNILFEAGLDFCRTRCSRRPASPAISGASARSV